MVLPRRVEHSLLINYYNKNRKIFYKYGAFMIYFAEFKYGKQHG